MTPIQNTLNKSFIEFQGSISVENKISWLKAIKKFTLSIFLLLVMAGLSTGCSGLNGRSSKSKYPLSGKSYVINGKRYHILSSAEGFKEKGLASWYGKPFHGRKTANGETYDMYQVSAAHKTLPLNTWVEVHNLNNKKTMRLRINDRGPFIDGRVIDLSYAAATDLGVYGPGTANVVVTAITDPQEISRLKAEATKRLAKAPPAEPKTAAKKPAATPTAKTQASALKNYMVQVSRTTDPNRAQSTAAKLEQNFKPVKIKVSHEKGSTYFQVRVEGFQALDQAKAAQNKLAQLGYKDAAVITQ